MEQLAQSCFVVAKAQASASLRNVASFASLFSATIWRDEIERFWASFEAYWLSYCPKFVLVFDCVSVRIGGGGVVILGGVVDD